MTRSTFRLSRWFQTSVYVSFGLLVATGAGWMIAQPRVEQPVWNEMPALLLKIHGAAAMLVLLVLGSLLPHIKRGWKARKNRFTGACVIALNLFLIVTGYGLYYSGSDEMRAWLSRWHGWVGLFTVVILPAHIFVGRAIIRRSHRRLRPAGAAENGRQRDESLL